MNQETPIAMKKFSLIKRRETRIGNFIITEVSVLGIPVYKSQRLFQIT